MTMWSASADQHKIRRDWACQYMPYMVGSWKGLMLGPGVR
jgi:hypothetical protein